MQMELVTGVAYAYAGKAKLLPTTHEATQCLWGADSGSSLINDELSTRIIKNADPQHALWCRNNPAKWRGGCVALVHYAALDPTCRDLTGKLNVAVAECVIRRIDPDSRQN
jgi:hypothetical protein